MISDRRGIVFHSGVSVVGSARNYEFLDGVPTDFLGIGEFLLKFGIA